jgi:hypothetical protein
MPCNNPRYAYADENGATVFHWDGRKSLAAAFSHAKRRRVWRGRFAEVVRFVKDTKTGKLFPITMKGRPE